MSAEVLFDNHFKTSLARDVGAMLLGNSIAYGTFRHVYEHATSDDFIVKLENVGFSYCNAMEWLIWEVVKDRPHLARWFAPCERISLNGTVLIMRKTEKVEQRELPKKVPSFFADLKVENWGRLNDRIVCHDYGNNYILENGLTAGMVAADWHDNG